MKGPEAHKWEHTHSLEFRKLLTETSTMHFCHPNQKPAGQIASYYNPQCTIKKKDDEDRFYRIRGTIGGDRLDYPGETSSSTADITTVKLLWNAVVSEPASKFMTLDVKDYFLNTELERPEYMWINLSMIPKDIQDDYGVTTYAVDGPQGRRVMVVLRFPLVGPFNVGPILAWINLDHINSLSFDLMALSENLESFLYVSW